MQKLIGFISLYLSCVTQAHANTDAFEAWGTAYHRSCGHYTATEASVAIKFEYSVAATDQVVAHIGFGGWDWKQPAGSSIEWRDIQDLTPTSTNGQTHWFEVTKVIARRISSINLTNIQAVLKVIHEDGSVTWVRGDDRAHSFFHADILTNTQGLPCLPTGESQVAKLKLNDRVVIRD